MAFSGENAESYYDEGLTANMKGDIAKAVASFEKAIQLDASYLAAYHQLAKCYLRAGNAARAAALLEKVVARKPKLVPPRLDLGQALLRAGRTADARKQFEILIAASPNNARARLGLAKASFDEANWPEAVAEAQQALALAAPSFPVLFVLARAARLAGNDALAEKTFDDTDKLLKKTVELQPEQPEGYYLRGEVAFARGQYGAALELYRSADDRVGREDRTRLHSAFGEDFCLADVIAKQGLCYQRLGKNDRAQEMGKRVLEIDPEHMQGKALSELE